MDTTHLKFGAVGVLVIQGALVILEDLDVPVVPVLQGDRVVLVIPDTPERQIAWLVEL